jgi:acyl-CoA reductase-like NAD-dependent aldehyde dehydrogenase
MNRNYIAGEWTAGAAARPNINPSDVADVVGEYAHADAEQTETAIAAANAAFPGWARGSLPARADALDRIGAELLGAQGRAR